ncbi:MAG: hypothetical protein ACKOTE_01540, partial [Opitutaceae bacterium]
LGLFGGGERRAEEARKRVVLVGAAQPLGDGEGRLLVAIAVTGGEAFQPERRVNLRDGNHGAGHKRQGDPKWLRLTEQWTASAKSVFQFDVQGQVANSTHAGLPWLRYLRQKCGGKLHFWPFDGWDVPAGKSAVAEVYPSLWMKRFPAGDRDGDQQAAFAVAEWLRRADQNDSLARFLRPPLTPAEQTQAAIEGWILGVT